MGYGTQYELEWGPWSAETDSVVAEHIGNNEGMSYALAAVASLAHRGSLCARGSHVLGCMLRGGSACATTSLPEGGRSVDPKTDL